MASASTRHFAVIGAGAGGLCAAKNLRRAGFDVTILELGSRIGGLWVYNNDSGLSPAYRSLHINSEARVSAYIDFPFRAGGPLYPDHEEMARYFTEYADHFDLTRLIRFNSRVASITPEGGRFRIGIAGQADEMFDGVVVATGHQSIPRHPDNIAGFTGEYLHAHDYRMPEPYTGKSVLVIGPGNSGVDIVSDICTMTARAVLCARSPVLIMPRMMFGVPNSRILGKVEKPWVPWPVRIWARTMLTRMFHGRMEQWGFRTPKTRTHPISHPTLISHIAWQRVAVRPGIRSVAGQEISFVDGSTERFDAVIAATGYLTEFPFLPEALAPVRGSRLNLYNRTVHPDIPGLYFVGFFDVSGGSNIRMMDDQSDYITAIATGRIARPARSRMTMSIEEDNAFQARQFPHSPRYGLELDPVRYRERLARDYKRNGLPPRSLAALTVRPPRVAAR